MWVWFFVVLLLLLLLLLFHCCSCCYCFYTAGIAIRDNNTQNITIDSGMYWLYRWTLANPNPLFSLTDVTSARSVGLYLLATLVILIVLLRLVYETSRQVIQSRILVFLHYVIKLCLYATSILFVALYWSERQCIALWQWQCGVVAVFLSWLNLMIFIAKFPLIGIYVIMLLRVFYTFVKVVLLSFLLVVAFGISFHMAFREPSILVRITIYGAHYLPVIVLHRWRMLALGHSF